MNAVSGIRIFEKLPDEARSQVEGMIHWKDYPANAEIISHKEKSTDVYFVGKGHVRSTMFSKSGKEVTYRDLFQGETFGEVSALDGLPRSSSVVAVESSEVGIMSSTDFVQLIHRHPEVADAVMLKLVSMIRGLTDRIYLYDAMAVTDRVRTEILYLARKHMTGPNTATIPDMPKHAEIANRIDTHREAVTRELNVLNKMGLIQRTGRELTVTDVARLANLLPEG